MKQRTASPFTGFSDARYSKGALVVVCLATMVPLWGCKRKVSRTSSAGAERALASIDASQKVSDGMKLLVESIQHPTGPFHFSYRAKENVAEDAKAKPEVGLVEIEAEVSPDELSVHWVRGEKKMETRATRGDQINWPMAQLELTEAMFDPGVALAYGASAARLAGEENVGGVAADQYVFDTTALTAGPQAAGLLLAFKSVKGSAWLDKSTGRIMKFNIDAELKDKTGNTWSEHHELAITPTQAAAPPTS